MSNLNELLGTWHTAAVEFAPELVLPEVNLERARRDERALDHVR